MGLLGGGKGRGEGDANKPEEEEVPTRPAIGGEVSRPPADDSDSAPGRKHGGDDQDGTSSGKGSSGGKGSGSGRHGGKGRGGADNTSVGDIDVRS